MDIVAFLRERAAEYRCPLCKRSLADCRLRQLEHEGQKYTVEVTCRNCQLAFLVALELTSAEEVVARSDAEDEVAEEMEAAPDPISDEELLAVRRALRRHTGPLTALLEGRPHG